VDKKPWEKFNDKMYKLAEAEWSVTDELDKATIALLDSPLVVLDIEEGHPLPDRPEIIPNMDDISFVFEGSLPAAVPSESYLKLIGVGWVYDGLHHRGGGMGCHVCHEFTHEKYGRLSFEADISHMADGTSEWTECAESAPFLDYSSWFLMLDGDDNDWDFTGKVTRVDSGETLDQLDMVLKIVDAGY
jgi:hypothetical protein